MCVCYKLVWSNVRQGNCVLISGEMCLCQFTDTLECGFVKIITMVW